MLAEFFARGSWSERTVDWGGLLVVTAHAVWAAYLKFRINAWYSGFFDLVQSGVVDASGDTDMAASREAVYASLAAFACIVAPSLAIHPLQRWLRSHWTLRWRLALVRSYLRRWDANLPPIEGASQRVHEDTGRFARGVEVCVVTVLDAVLTLCVFGPVLHEVGEQVACPLRSLRPLGGHWLFLLAFAAAACGLGVAVVAGRRLVWLEVENQKVEAELRRDLVVLETTPGSVCSLEDDGARSKLASPHASFVPTLKRLARNYARLFLNFLYLNGWLAAFDQAMVLAPYIIAGPLLFAAAPEERITLGSLVQLSNAFDRVFSSFSIVAENWASVNEFRSVLFRLAEFERQLDAGIAGEAQLGLMEAAADAPTRAV